MQLGHAIGAQADFGPRSCRPVDVLADDIFLQPELGVVAEFLGVVMAAGLDRERPRHAGPESLEGLLAAFVTAVMVVGPVQPETGGGDVRRVGLGRDGRQVQLLARRFLRFDVRHAVHPDTARAVIFQPADPEIGDDRLDPRIHAEIPHQRAAVGITLGPDPVRVDLRLGQQIAERPPLDGVPDIVRGLAGIGDRATILAL